jgi:hypothetical protein
MGLKTNLLRGYPPVHFAQPPLCILHTQKTKDSLKTLEAISQKIALTISHTFSILRGVTPVSL